MSKTLEEIPEDSSTKSKWIRGLYILLFCIISYVAGFVLFVVVVFQFIAQWVLKKPNEHLLHFGQSLGVYAYDIIRFLTYNTDEMPFPFKSWPNNVHLSEHTRNKSHHEH